MAFTLQAFKNDTLASDITDSATSMTLTTGAFGTPTGEQMLVIDYDITAKREIVKCAIDGTAITSIDRAQDGTSAVAHTSGAKVIMAYVPSHHLELTTAIAALQEPDGWNSADETWAYASATTITVPAGAAAKYSVGDKIKLTQTTVKYFTVTAVADTVLTVTGGTDYTVANAAITANYYSKGNAVGHPEWFAYTPTYGGFTGAVTTTLARFCVEGRKVTLYFDCSGTSNADTFTLTLPVPAVAKRIDTIGSGMDNGSWVAGGANLAIIAASPTLLTLYKGGNLATWTTSGTKAARGTICYEI